jgi:U3 small nucleolar RNA-associated protein 18
MPWQDLDTSDIVISDKSNDRIKKLRDKRKLTKWQTNQFEKRLRERYQETALRTSHTQWASVTEDKKPVNADDDISAKQETIQESGIVFARKASRLPPNVIEIVRLKDVNAAEPSDAVVRSIAFHPTSDFEMPLLMTAGLDKCLRFYSVGKDEESRKIHGIQCKSSLSVDAIKLNVNFMPHHTLYSFSSKASDLQGLVFT